MKNTVHLEGDTVATLEIRDGLIVLRIASYRSNVEHVTKFTMAEWSMLIAPEVQTIGSSSAA